MIETAARVAERVFAASDEAEEASIVREHVRALAKQIHLSVILWFSEEHGSIHDPYSLTEAIYRPIPEEDRP